MDLYTAQPSAYRRNGLAGTLPHRVQARVVFGAEVIDHAHTLHAATGYVAATV
jgi:hypothetical protein